MSPSHRMPFAALVLLGALVALPHSGCLPLTFSNDGEIDFERYATVYVEPIVDSAGYRTDADAYMAMTARDYLVSELRAESGFAGVTRNPDDAVDLVLSVELEFWEVVDEQVIVDPGGWTYVEEDVEFEAEAYFVARTPDGAVVDRGEVSDSSVSLEECLEDTLDEIALHYLRPYRI